MNVDSVVAAVEPIYVAVPLAVEFGTQAGTLGDGFSTVKIASYKNFNNKICDVSSEDLKASSQLEFNSVPSVRTQADFIIVAITAPVGVDQNSGLTSQAGATTDTKPQHEVRCNLGVAAERPSVRYVGPRRESGWCLRANNSAMGCILDLHFVGKHQ